MAAILLFHNNEMAAMLVYQTGPILWELNSFCIRSIFEECLFKHISSFCNIRDGVFQNISSCTSWPSGHSVSLLILTFVNGCIAFKTSLINTKLRDFVNIGQLFLTMWINSYLSHNLQTRLARQTLAPVFLLPLQN